jgi:hypothetical protein
MKLLILLFLVSCGDASYTELTRKYSLPAGLQDCQVYQLNSDGMGKQLTVLRCPKSDTTTAYRCGKHCNHNNTIIDD